MRRAAQYQLKITQREHYKTIRKYIQKIVKMREISVFLFFIILQQSIDVTIMYF